MKLANAIITDGTTLTVMQCPVCAVHYAIPEMMRANAERVGNHRDEWYCPNGHQLGYGESDADRLKKKLDAEQQRRERAERRGTHLSDQLQASERSRSAMKGVVTRTKRRVGHGVCPCCNRSFSDLQRHMEGQHPDYAESSAER